MREDAGALRLADEAGAELFHLVIAQRIADAERLERHQPADQRVTGEIDDPHRALSELVEDLVTSEFGRGQR
jgi:hypothetical protein